MKQNVYSVTQVNTYIRNMITQDYLCSSILVRGELSNVKYHGSGHIYFTLKDAGAAISCIMYASDRKNLNFKLEDGLMVVCGGSISVYVAAGKYQIYVKQVEAVGGGLLYEQFEQIKNELKNMGMFDACYKQKIPSYVKKLGVVTASTGAAIHDIITVSKRRNPYIEIVLYPAIVQGQYAVDSIVRGIKELEKQDIDVMIVGRGGGSMEDLWAFNSVEVAQAVFDCSVPIISAVGHETDTTIIDYVSDLRAPTPSAAAELAVCDVSLLIERTEELKRQLVFKMNQKTQKMQLLTEQYSLKLKNVSPQNVLREKRLMLISMEDTLNQRMEQKIQGSRARFNVLVSALSALSPMQKLSQGYAYVTDSKDVPVLSAKSLHENDEMNIYLKDGVAVARIEKLLPCHFDEQ